MNTDISRSTTDFTKGYTQVRMQQGRVPTDADSNEQGDLTLHRIEREALDVIGPSGAPVHNAGFNLTPAKKGATLLISAGRFYVDGILCENRHAFLIGKQPYLPGVEQPTVPGTYAAYLDVWSRSVTALEDPSIREVALGGPDTATRVQNIWQIKMLNVGDENAELNCASDLPGWSDLIAPATARMSARAEPDVASTDPCVINPGAGYRRLENQFYRVEIHRSGNVTDATFVWSRENGSIVAGWLEQNGNDLKVSTLGRDEVLRIASGQWVELIDDTCELQGRPGTLVQVIKAERQTLTIDPTTAKGSVLKADFPRNPRIRAWDSVGELSLLSTTFIILEDGIEVLFDQDPQTSYHTGQYWWFAARTNTGKIEWPMVGGQPESCPPEGIQHHYARLAMLKFDGKTWTRTADCRHLFPPLTEMTTLRYLGGDGQEVMPDLTLVAKPNLVRLPHSLRVGVLNGELPVVGAIVQFSFAPAAPPSGLVNGLHPRATVVTDTQGVAECTWDINAAEPVPAVEAVLLDAAGNSTGQMIRFTANLSTAANTAYDPKNAPSLASAHTVQEAIDILAKADHHGCCCVSVGKNGEFPRLVDVLDKFRGQQSLCVCLMAGEHLFERDGLLIPSNSEIRHLRIIGCGPSTRLTLKAGALDVRGLRSFVLRDLTLLSDQPLVGLPIALPDKGTPKKATRKLSQKKVVSLPILTPQFNPKLGLLTVDECELVEVSNCVFSGNIGNDVCRFGTLRDLRFFGNTIQANVIATKAAIAIFGSQMVSVDGNFIGGDVRLNGISTAMADAAFQALITQLMEGDQENGISVDGVGEWRFHGNQITGRMTVDSAVKVIVATKRIAPAARRLSLTDNTFGTGRQQFLAGTVSFTSNHFSGPERALGLIGARNLVAATTTAELPMSAISFHATWAQVQHANLVLFNGV